MNKSSISKIKIMLLLAMVFVLGGGTLVTMYATGEHSLDVTRMYMVSHTEYRYNETGQVVVRLVNANDVAIVVDNCTATILYPNKTVYLGPALMNSTIAISGDHYYSFVTPSAGPEGVYEYQAICSWNGGAKTQSATNSFHLSSAFSTLQTSVDGISTQLNNNVTQILTAIGNINVSVNLTPILDNQVVMQAYLSQINTTTQDTYTYLTTTLATNINSILSGLGVINATVNRIETNTLSINNTVNSILQNQQDQVYMNVYSG